MDLPQLLERDEVLDALSALVAGASDDGGRLVLLAGEAGIGKTSVVQRLAGRWDHRAVVLVGACDPLDTPRPLSPLLDIAADASSGITELVAGGVTGPELFAALVERISGTARPTLLLRLDPESRAVVEMVAVAPRSLDPGVGAGGSLTMVAVEYIVPNSPEVAADPPMLFDRHFHLNTDLDVWVLHAWVWKKNPHRDVRGLQPEGRRLPLT